VPAIVLAVDVPHLLLVWHGAPAELGRVGLELAVSARVALWALVLFLADATIATRRRPA
jgi:hypothetical protein